jgi:hypothetical protein
MSDKKRAIDALRKIAEAKVKPYKKKLSKKVEKYAKTKLKDLGVDPKMASKVAALAQIIKTGKIRGKYRIGKNTRLEGEIDAKNKSVKAELKHEF